MHFPWWYVPDVTSPMLIAGIAVIHVLIAHYAVGGGLFLAMETGFAYKTRNSAYLDYLKRHTRFFVLLTAVLGALTGVGIWWTIGLASPLGTEVLIRVFVFGWATEWVFFVVEITAAFVFYYYWGRLPPRTHVVIGWIYGGAAWISLVLITGITAFMLHPGGWLEHRSFWAAFFNPQFIPQTIARTGGALLLTSLYVYLHASLTLKDAAMRDLIGTRSARPALLGSILIAVGGIGWYVWLPESAQAVLASAAVLNVLIAILFALTVIVFILLYLGPYRNPGWLSPGFALALFLFGLAAFSTGEFIREAVRKPYISYNVVLGNQIFPEAIPSLREGGYLEGGVWPKAFVSMRFPEVIVDGKIDRSRLLELPDEDRLLVGETIFHYHCNDCHATTRGYSPAGPVLTGRSRESIHELVTHLDESHFFMPPWAGTEEEAQLLTDYLVHIAPPRPGGMIHRDIVSEENP
jgi:cytochrome bd ubiquinol oxidase subunit I